MLRTEFISEIFLAEAFALNHEALINMIKNRRIVSIYYLGEKEAGEPKGWRKIECYAYGEDHGVKYLRAWQLSGKTVTGNNRWKFFRIDRISNVNFASNKTFDKPRPMFNDKGDKHLSKIYALADFGKSNKPNKTDTNQPNGPGGKGKNTSLVKKLRTLKELMEL